MTDQAITALTARIGTRAACAAVGAAQASYYRRHRISPAPPGRSRCRTRDRHQPRALSAAERQAILDVLHGERFADPAPAEVWATLLDEGIYLGSSPPSTGCCVRRARPASAAARPPTRPRSSPSCWPPGRTRSSPGTSPSCTARRSGRTTTCT